MAIIWGEFVSGHRKPLKKFALNFNFYRTHVMLILFYKERVQLSTPLKKAFHMQNIKGSIIKVGVSEIEPTKKIR